MSTGQWEVCAWRTTLFHAGPPNATQDWQWVIHFTISNLPDPTSGSFSHKYPRMFLKQENGKVWDIRPSPLVCRSLTQGEEWILQL